MQPQSPNQKVSQSQPPICESPIKIIIDSSMRSSHNNVKQQQYTMRDDVIQLSYDIVHSARNHFRKRTSFKGTEGHNKQISIDIKNVNMSKIDDNLEKSGRYNKRDIFTSANTNSSRNRGSGSFKISKTQSMQMQRLNKIKANLTSQTPISTSQELLPNHPHPSTHQNLFRSFLHSSSHEAEGPAASFKALQQKHNKYNQKDSSVQSWLNQALLQASPNLPPTKSQQNSGLKQYNIDRSSLIKAGLHSQNVNRLYRSLFVYSLGFNNLLQELCGKSNKILRNNIWKTFAVLLQYSSGGNFTTTIGEIQRDKQHKLGVLRAEIQARQKQLEEYDQQADKKNMKIVKEYRELQKEKKQLQEERDVILQDFHQAEQAFNQEISLRLKYETRINQIHGVYEELNQKYKLAKEQIQKDKVDIKMLKDTISKLRQQLGIIKIQSQQKSQQIQQTKYQMQQVLDQNNTLQQSSKTATQSYLTSKHQTQLHVQSLSNQSRTISNMTHQLNNNKSTAQSLFQTLQSKSHQFQKSMKQNKELHAHIQRDTEHINQLLQELREVRSRQGQQQALVEVERKKLEEREAAVKVLYGKLQELEIAVREKDVVILSQIEKREAVEKDIQNCYQNINQMKTAQSKLTQQLQSQKNLTAIQYQRISQLKQSLQKQQRQLQNLNTKIHQKALQIAQLKSSVQMLQEQKSLEKNTHQQTLKKTEQEFERQREKNKQLIKLLRDCQGQLEGSKAVYDKVYAELKNQRFQRNNLQLYYKQSLTVMEEQIAHIKKLSIEISELKESLENSKRKYAVLENIHHNKVELLERDVSMWKKCYEQTQRKQRQRRSYIHPMLLQDLQSQTQRLSQNLSQKSQSLSQQTRKLQQVNHQKTLLQQNQMSAQIKSTQQLHITYSKKIETLSQQLSYTTDKLAYKEEELASLNKQAIKLREDKIEIEDYLRNKEKQYMGIINEKNKQLNSLNQKYRNLLDAGEQNLKLKAKQSQSSKQQNQLKDRIAKLQQQLKYHTQREKHLQKLHSQQHPSPTKQPHPKKQAHPHQLNEEKRGWHNNTDRNDEQSELEKLDSKEQAPNIDSANEIAGGEGSAIQKSQENYKKREEIRKNIKGAYLYYAK